MSVTPIKSLGQLPEHGRIRTGVKSGRAMKALDTFRFTSVDKQAIESLAALYGGTVKAWKEPKANPPDQWEVISEASEIEVAIQPGSADANYELWSGGGRQRSCDGESCSVTETTPNDVSYVQQSCICSAQGVLECKPKTRVNVLFTGIKFAGTWRYESGGMNALHTLPSMLQLIEMLQSNTGLLPVTMALVPQTIRKGGQTRKFTIVQFRPDVTVDEMLSGSGTYQAQVGTGDTVMAPSPELGAVSSQTPTTTVIESDPVVTENTSASPVTDDEIVDAEIVEDDTTSGGMTKKQAMDHAKEHGGSVRKVGGAWMVT